MQIPGAEEMLFPGLQVRQGRQNHCDVEEADRSHRDEPPCAGHRDQDAVESRRRHGLGVGRRTKSGPKRTACQSFGFASPGVMADRCINKGRVDSSTGRHTKYWPSSLASRLGAMS